MALQHVDKAHGMAKKVARRAGMGYKTLFRALSEHDDPTLSTVKKVLHAMGWRLCMVQLNAAVARSFSLQVGRKKLPCGDNLFPLLRRQAQTLLESVAPRTCSSQADAPCVP